MDGPALGLPAVCEPPASDADIEALQFEDFFTFRLSLLNDLLGREGARRWFSRFGLTLPQRRLLLSIGRFPGRSIAELSRITQMDKAQVSRSGRDLERRGVVRSRDDDDDARLKRLDLTAEGKKLHRAVFKVAQARQAAILSALGRAEVRELYRLLAKLTACGLAGEAGVTGDVTPHPRGRKHDNGKA